MKKRNKCKIENWLLGLNDGQLLIGKSDVQNFY